MGNFERLNVKVFQYHRFFFLQIADGRVQLLRHAITFIDSLVDACSSVDRDMQLLTQSAHRLNMVRMVVCDEYSTYRLHADTHLF